MRCVKKKDGNKIMKVLELEEGKQYTISNGLKFKKENKVLKYYDSVYHQWIRSGIGYNEALELDFTEEGET